MLLIVINLGAEYDQIRYEPRYVIHFRAPSATKLFFFAIPDVLNPISSRFLAFSDDMHANLQIYQGFSSIQTIDSRYHAEHKTTIRVFNDLIF
ncbi:hypothetical protein BB779_24580 (plasmid) [Pseudomonas viridiflava]|nr:hypothetical protein BB779_24580 [Pseudomonas viridiflava]